MNTDRASRAAAPTADVVERNIRALLLRRQEEDRAKTLEERLADAITRFAGSMKFVYLHLALFGTWIATSVGWTPLPRFDPSLVLLAMFASVEAIFLSTFVLITQNRMANIADRRADLDLQISLLSEHEVTRLIGLVSEMAKHMGLEATRGAELSDLAQDVAPEQVLDKLEETERRMAEGQ